MCTKLEKELAATLSNLICKFKLQSEYAELLPKLAELESAEVKEEKAARVSYTYKGLECLNKTQAEREKDNHGLCRISIMQGEKIILEIFWDSTLQWIMKPCDGGKRFDPVCRQKLPTGGATRQFLKKLADAELEKPGSFAEKYYPAMPMSIAMANAACH